MQNMKSQDSDIYVEMDVISLCIQLFIWNKEQRPLPAATLVNMVQTGSLKELLRSLLVFVARA